ncbi:MAG: 50S ribosomal protein L29 [Bacteroidetes bacterium]|nr:50S ribosomal protein L29 [Bacteroidota bacterium]MCB0841710.1 50S ribosomal protein L29 [Bacteroidota bacterium]
MKAKEIRDLTTDEIVARLKEERDKLLKLRLNHAVSAIENPSEIQETRKTLARLNTILRERQLAEEVNN